MANIGRPKKQVDNTQSELTNSQESVTLSHTALGIAKSPTTGEWQLIRIKYDPVTRSVGEIEEEMASSFVDGAREKFKITVAREVFGKNN